MSYHQKVVHLCCHLSVRDYYGRNTSGQREEVQHRKIDPFLPTPLFLHDNPAIKNSLKKVMS